MSEKNDVKNDVKNEDDNALFYITAFAYGLMTIITFFMTGHIIYTFAEWART